MRPILVALAVAVFVAGGRPDATARGSLERARISLA
jgi:hypothetical protein